MKFSKFSKIPFVFIISFCLLHFNSVVWAESSTSEEELLSQIDALLAEDDSKEPSPSAESSMPAEPFPSSDLPSASELSKDKKALMAESKKSQKGYTVNLKKLIVKAKEKLKNIDKAIRARDAKETIAQRNGERAQLAQEHFDKGNQFFEAGDYARAKKEWEKVIKITSHPEIKNYVKKSDRTLKQKKTIRNEEEKQQKRHLRNQRKENLAEVKELYRAATFLYKQKKFAAAKTEFQKIESLIPDYRGVRNYLKTLDHEIEKQRAELAKKKQKEESALRKQEMVRDQRQQHQQTREQAEILFQEAVGLYKSRRYTEAKVKFQELESMRPNYRWTRRYLKRIDKDIERQKARGEEPVVKEEVADKAVEPQKRKKDVVRSKKEKERIKREEYSKKEKIRREKERKKRQAYKERQWQKDLMRQKKEKEKNQRREAKEKVAQQKIKAKEMVRREKEEARRQKQKEKEQARREKEQRIIQKEQEKIRARREKKEQRVQEAKEKEMARLTREQEKEQARREKEKQRVQKDQEKERMRLAREQEKQQLRREREKEKDQKQQQKLEARLARKKQKEQARLEKDRAQWQRKLDNAQKAKEPAPGMTPSAQLSDGPPQQKIADKKEQARELYEEGVIFYRDKNYVVARQKFRKVQQLDPSHRPTKRYLKKIGRKLSKKQTAKVSKDDMKPRTLSVQESLEAEMLYQEALLAYDNGYYRIARVKFEDLAEIDKNYKSSKEYLQRIPENILEDKKRVDDMIRKELDLLENQRKWERENMDEEIKALRDEIEKMYYEGVELFQSGQYQESRSKFYEVEALFSNYRDIQEYIERIDTLIGRQQSASIR